VGDWCTKALSTGQLLVDKTNTFMFDMENREGAKQGRLTLLHFPSST